MYVHFVLSCTYTTSTGDMMTITATASGQTFTRKTSAAWTHAVITVHDNGVAQCNWFKTAPAANKYASFKSTRIASGLILSVEVVLVG